MPFVDDAASKVIDETIAGEFEMLLGRRTYEIFAAYRPNQGDTPIAKAFNRATKYVVTRSLDIGKRLFENGVPPRGLTLVETGSTPSGVSSTRTIRQALFRGAELPVVGATRRISSARNEELVTD
jgi:hypothetical protein